MDGGRSSSSNSEEEEDNAKWRAAIGSDIASTSYNNFSSNGYASTSKSWFN